MSRPSDAIRGDPRRFEAIRGEHRDDERLGGEAQGEQSGGHVTACLRM